MPLDLVWLELHVTPGATSEFLGCRNFSNDGGSLSGPPSMKNCPRNLRFALAFNVSGCATVEGSGFLAVGTNPRWHASRVDKPAEHGRYRELAARLG